MPHKRSRPSAQQRILVILDMNGVLLTRSGQKKQNAQLRPHLEALLDTLWGLQDRLVVAVWSSMIARNLHPLVEVAFGNRAEDLAFVWDQSWCTYRRVPGMAKPLLRKDLVWLSSSPWASYVPDSVLLVDDDPIKCSENPAGTAIHPSTFTTSATSDTELLRLAAYLQVLASSECGSVPEFVLARPYDSFQEEEVPPLEPPAKRLRGCGIESGGDSDGSEPVAGLRAVEAFWQDAADWLPARLLQALPDGSGWVRWDEDGSESTVPPDWWRDPVRRWRRVESRKKPGVFYYHDASTGETQLEPPAPWEQRESRRQAGVFYYWNRVTGVTSVEKPDLEDL
uniref:Mitochondrial import inner membrane translocase subunit TIM50 n=1 Tax=Pyrodinium bahamense TaxID=73915 RepID=A0A7S0FTN1_9DINO|mmetsp:Transcript_47607/g.132410  ORF Transcript_47607/g.132410 Transcript_47607/m.132410 type:complete len:339 (+) Transcript_47607:116-1132(+)|eukprot:CAMPEP_0179099444 /NCGR_PEP_ID=MMETSP0796-20121207/45877_1 /TAXON_ID=73915 /ORGANISM="Pyrodinium bahamense, Strain pbaha01" /LENGTH=338 /DNA_ID=CAMNT_0020797243 /DNA_START=62 /DNA_END=1078 /DNA_ORIENTATION=-